MCLPDCACLVVTYPLVLAIGVMDPLVVRATDPLALGITDPSLVVRVTVFGVTDPLVNLIV